MAVDKVTADVNGESYRLVKVGQDNYERSLSAPATANDYSVLVRVSDDAGNVTEVNSQLKVNIDPNSVDLRQAILTNELGDIMLDMVAPIYDKSALTLYVFQALGTILSKEADFIDGDFISQIFPQTATWGLVAWEDEFGIIPDDSKTIEQRRTYLMSVIFKKTPMTPYRIKQIVTGITGMECEVIENIEPNTMFITIRGYFPEISVVKSELNRKLPAHLNFIIRMAELTGIEVNYASGATVTEYEHYEMEVLN